MKYAVAFLLPMFVLGACSTGNRHASNEGISSSGLNRSMNDGSTRDAVKDMKEVHRDSRNDLRNSGAKHDEMFINLMIEHHNGAIMMAEEAYESAGKPELRALASEMIRVQRQEQEQLQTWRKQWYNY